MQRDFLGLRSVGCLAAAACGLGVISPAARGQMVVGKCAFVDFEVNPLGAFSGAFYYASNPGQWFVGNGPGAGVTFSALSNPPCVAPNVIAAVNTAYLPLATKVLKAGTCPASMLPGCICMVFNENQQYVTFDVFQPMLDSGVIGSVRISAYSNQFCGNTTGLLPGYPITVAIPPGFGSPTQYASAHVKLFEDCNIRRIEVCPVSVEPRQEPALDNVAWGVDALPAPSVTITSPLYLQCYCPGDTINVLGTGCDTSCERYTEKLEFTRGHVSNSQSPTTTWTQIGATRTTCMTGTLYSFPASVLVPASETLFTLKVTGTNFCGTEKTSITMVRIDRAAPVATLSCPPNGSFISTGCEPLVIAGNVTDDCAGTWTLSVIPPGGPSTFLIGASGVGSNGNSFAQSVGFLYNAPVDGAYTLNLAVNDNCGGSSVDTKTFIVDNTAPLAMIATPPACSYMCPGYMYAITGRAFDLHLDLWLLEYLDSNGVYQPIASGTINVGTPTTTGLLANWTVPANGTPCCSQLRLTVKDRTGRPSPCIPAADPGCNITVVSRPVSLRIPCDFDGNGVINSQDFFSFLNCFFSPPCP